MNCCRSILLVLAVLLVVPNIVCAEWSIDPTVNNVVCNNSEEKTDLQSLPDGSGGIYAVWSDDRTGQAAVYIQHLDAEGNVLWDPDGLPVCTFLSTQLHFSLVTDMAGGVIVVWLDSSSSGYNIYAQRINSDGQHIWPPSGAIVCTHSGQQWAPDADSDGYGGVVVGWQDLRTDDGDIYVQRLDENGDRLWAADGVGLCVETGAQYSLATVEDGNGGAVVAWSDTREETQVYARRVNYLGTPIWHAGGNQISAASFRAAYPSIVRTTSSRLIIVWFDQDGSSAVYRPRAQILNAAGGKLLSSSGLVIGPSNMSSSSRTDLICDGGEGAYFTWESNYTDGYNIYAQHLSSEGALEWSNQAKLVCDVDATQTTPKVTTDQSGGAIITWYDTRTSAIYYNGSIYGQRYDVFGNELWQPEAQLIQLGSSLGFISTVSDGQGGIISCWVDSRNNRYDVYAQGTDDTGYLGNADPSIIEIVDFPNDQGGEVTLSWQSSYLDAMPWHVINNYSVWMRPADSKKTQMPSAEELSELANKLQLAPEKVAGFAKVGWTYLKQVPAVLASNYSCLAPTFGDFIGAETSYTEYMVMGHGDDPWITWESGAVEGCSIDNIEPGIPLSLAGGWDSPTTVSLNWGPEIQPDPDLAYFRIYRGSVSGFEVAGSAVVGQCSTNNYLDETTHQTWYYRVTAVDVHGNESDASNELIVSPTTAVPDSEEIPESFALNGNWPNPFNPSTQIGFDLPQDTYVSLSVYALDGSRVTTLVQRTMAAGSHNITWNGLDNRGRAMTTGMYVYKIEAGQFQQSSKMTLIR